MIPSATITVMTVVAVVSFLLPVVIAAVIKLKAKVSLASFFAGMLIFLVCFIVSSATSVLFSSVIPGIVLLVIVSSLRAGVVEESGRLLAFSTMLKKRDTVADALIYGAGHGGMEVWLLLTLTMTSNIVLATSVNTMGIETYTALVPGQAEAIVSAVEALAQISVSELIWAFVERLSAMALHISLSVVVFYAARMKKTAFYFLSILLHTLVNCTTLLYYLNLTGTEVFEIVVFAAMLPVAYLAWRLAKKYKIKSGIKSENVTVQ